MKLFERENNTKCFVKIELNVFKCVHTYMSATFNCRNEVFIKGLRRKTTRSESYFQREKYMLHSCCVMWTWGKWDMLSYLLGFV